MIESERSRERRATVATKGRGRRSAGGGGQAFAMVAAGAKVGALLFVGIVAGYCWRSFFPVALPFESRLVSDKSSDDVATSQLRELVRSANERADRVEREKKTLAARVQELESARAKAQQELADLQIKNVLRGE
jgi:uncharacterized protein (UPF0335 family)